MQGLLHSRRSSLSKAGAAAGGGCRSPSNAQRTVGVIRGEREMSLSCSQTGLPQELLPWFAEDAATRRYLGHIFVGSSVTALLFVGLMVGQQHIQRQQLGGGGGGRGGGARPGQADDPGGRGL